MSQIIFLDVDGTLIDYQAKLPLSAEEAVNKARAHGHRVYICTGCSKAEIAMRDFRSMELDGMIGANGGYVEDHGKVVMHQALSKAEVKHIVDWCNARQIGFYLEANSGLYINDYYVKQGPEAMYKYVIGKGKTIDHPEAFKQDAVNDYTLLHGEDLYREDVNKVSFVLRSYQDHLDSIKEFPDLVANTWGGRDEQALFGDLGPKGITKEHAIHVLLDYLHEDASETIAFGDAKIDLSMFACCQYNVAMGNGGLEIKAAADYITDDVNHDGLYKAFEYLHLFD